MRHLERRCVGGFQAQRPSIAPGAGANLVDSGCLNLSTTTHPADGAPTAPRLESGISNQPYRRDSRQEVLIGLPFTPFAAALSAA